MATPSMEVVSQLRELLGEKNVRVQPDDILPEVILRPENTTQVSDILKICSAAGQALIPLGGKTGLVNGHARTGSELGLSLERMNAIEEVDTRNRTMTVQAGCILQLATEAAAEQNLLLPLDLGARGSATVGGNLATNAGGNRVIRYGMVRDMVLGLEVVLADGTVVTNLNKLLKNNTGYDVKQLFIGAEGTLGVITRAVLRLRPLPKSQNTALVAVTDFSCVVQLLHHLDEQMAGTLAAFEVMWPAFYEYVTRDGSLHRAPLAHGSAYYVLVETLGSEPESDVERFETVLGAAMEQGLLADAVIARSQAERNALWEIRDDVLVFFGLGPIIPFDVSISVDAMESFVAAVNDGVRHLQEPICVVFGHVGDSNLHVILGTRKASEFDAEGLEQLLYDCVERHQGSISAEHGVGLVKREHLHRSRSTSELQLMMNLKRMLDPQNILNPNKIFAVEALATASNPGAAQ